MDGFRILLIDDQAFVGAWLQPLLASSRECTAMVMRQATTAAEGRRLAMDWRPHLILLDLNMPDESGLAQLASMLELGSADHPMAPIVILSAVMDAEMKRACFDAGASDFIVKGGQDPVEFVSRVQHHARIGMQDARRARRTSEIAESMDLLGRLQSADEVEELALTLARHLTDADAGAIWSLELPAPGIAPPPAGRMRFSRAQSSWLEGRMGKGVHAPAGLDTVDPPRQGEKPRLAAYVRMTGRCLRLENASDMPVDAPFLFDARFTKALDYEVGTVLCAPIKNTAGEVLSVMLLAKPRAGTSPGINTAPFTAEDEAAIEVFAPFVALALDRTHVLRDSHLRLIALANMRDPTETGAHVQRVADCSVAIFDRWAALHNMEPAEESRQRDQLRIAATLHDVGKTAVPDEILCSHGALDGSERARMETHTTCGARLFIHSHSAHDVAAHDVALHHHERWDGTGYPGAVSDAQLAVLPPEVGCNPSAPRLMGADIPLFARIVALADVYDALTSERRYKAAWPRERVVEYFREMTGKHFDPELTAIALELIPYFESVRAKHPDTALA